MGKKWDETSYVQLYCSCTRIDQRKCKVMVQQEGKAKEPVLPDSNEKEDNLLSVVEHFDCSSSTPVWWPYWFCHQHVSHNPRLGPPQSLEGWKIRMVSPSHTHQGTQFGQGATHNQAGHYPLRQVQVEVWTLRLGSWWDWFGSIPPFQIWIYWMERICKLIEITQKEQISFLPTTQPGRC